MYQDVAWYGGNFAVVAISETWIESRDRNGCCRFQGLDVSVSSGKVVKEGEVWHC